MKPESLHALIIDHELGELSPETVELLQEWLDEHSASAPDVTAIRRTLQTASAAVRRFPELAQPESDVAAVAEPLFRPGPLALAASILILLGGTAWLGFRAGQESAPQAASGSRHEPATIPSTTVEHDGPWARYEIASGPGGGLTIVRRDSNPQPEP